MPIKTACPSCEELYTLPDNLADKTVKCRGCKKPFAVKAGIAVARKVESQGREVEAVEEDEDEVMEVEAVDEGRPSKKRPSSKDEDEDPPSRRRKERDEEDDRPAKKKKKAASGGMPLWGWIAIGGGVLLAVVTVVVVLVVVSGSNSTKLTPENLAKVSLGMAESEVTSILGSPTETQTLQPPIGNVGGIVLPGARRLVYRAGNMQATFTVTNGIVTGISRRTQ